MVSQVYRDRRGRYGIHSESCGACQVELRLFGGAYFVPTSTVGTFEGRVAGGGSKWSSSSSFERLEALLGSHLGWQDLLRGT
jgi:hypothetical protein